MVEGHQDHRGYQAYRDGGPGGHRQHGKGGGGGFGRIAPHEVLTTGQGLVAQLLQQPGLGRRLLDAQPQNGAEVELRWGHGHDLRYRWITRHRDYITGCSLSRDAKQLAWFGDL